MEGTNPIDLERQLDELKSSTQHAIENSWEECERLYEVNAASENRIRDLEQKLELFHVTTEQKEARSKPRHVSAVDSCKAERSADKQTDMDQPADLMVAWNDNQSMDSCSSLEDESTSPSKRNRKNRLRNLTKRGSSEKMSIDGKSRGSSVTSATVSSSSTKSSSDRRGMMRRVSSLRLPKIRERTALEDQLMDQMAEMQQQHQMEIEEYAMKLQQREEAIKTLEKALALQSETVEMLRSEREESRGAEMQPADSVQTPSSSRRELTRTLSSRKMRRGWGSTSH